MTLRFKRIPTAATLIKHAYQNCGHDGTQAGDAEIIKAWKYTQLLSYLNRYHTKGADQQPQRGYRSWNRNQNSIIGQCISLDRVGKLWAEIERRGLVDEAEDYLIDDQLGN